MATEGSTEASAGPTRSECQFQGSNGATSLKAEIVNRIPRINDAATFRQARQLLQSLGGAAALRDELAFTGYIDHESGCLTATNKPFNVFAHMAAGKMLQHSLIDEQKALGEYRSKYLICANRPDHDLYWNSEEPYWIGKASMARRHRFLTTRDLHWQWFNMLVVGLVPPEDGGMDLASAVKEVEEIKAAAMHFAKHIPGWSSQVGVYVNIFGHNNVNSLFVHILDLSQVGPGFEYQFFKNCPLDDVLTVLHEEVAGRHVGSVVDHLNIRKASCGRITRKHDASVALSGADGATSLKEELIKRVPVLKDAHAYREARRLLNEELGGAMILSEELANHGWLDPDTGLLTTGAKPFNVFARVATGAMTQKGMDVEQRALGEYQDDFVICCNLPESDEHWESEDVQWVGKASMSHRHRFLTSKNTHWQWFNALVFGLVPQEANGASLKDTVVHCERMKAAALEYTRCVGGWSEKVGLYFHIFGHNSVNSLHVHILDLSCVGPAYRHFDYKNCPLDAVLQVLREELALQERRDEHDVLAEVGLPLCPSGYRRSDRQSTTTYSHSEDVELLHLSVGDEEVIIIPRETLLLAPKRSLLHRTFRVEWDSPKLAQGGKGQIVLDYPPRPFKLIVNHLRTLHLTPRDQMLNPPEVDPDIEREFKDLAWLLGVDKFLLGSPRPGAATESQLRSPWRRKSDLAVVIEEKT